MIGQVIDKTVMITGATGNLGSAVTRAFVAVGARVVMVDMQQERMDALAQELALDAGHYLPLVLDVTNPDSVNAALGKVTERFGHLDALVHTVGGYASGDPVHAGNLDVWHKMLTLNATGVYVLCGAVAQHMLDKGVSGSISVILAKAALGGMKNGAAYVASKAAAQRVVESMALELKDSGIRVNGVLPSIIDTPANRKDMPNADFSKWVAPAELANALLFLTSDAASGVTGATLEVYGRV